MLMLRLRNKGQALVKAPGSKCEAFVCLAPSCRGQAPVPAIGAWHLTPQTAVCLAPIAIVRVVRG
jgi:hypothetical protein